MRIHVLSDLHLEFGEVSIPAVDADVVVLAGDIHVGTDGLAWIRRTFPGTPVVYVTGNHEFYQGLFPDVIGDLRAAASGTNIHVLENDRFDVGDVTFLGATLWTDFNLYGDPATGCIMAEAAMNDFRLIRTLPGYRRLRASRLRAVHANSVMWLRTEAEKCRGRKIVVVTHYPPSARSIAERFAGQPLNVAFASNLDDLVQEVGACLWIHGHIHHAFDYRIGATRIVSNQRGYPREAAWGFRADLVVTV